LGGLSQAAASASSESLREQAVLQNFLRLTEPPPQAKLWAVKDQGPRPAFAKATAWRARGTRSIYRRN